MENYLSNIPVQWKMTHGKGVNIAIIDAGFDINNIYLKKNIKQYLDLGSYNIDHGTHVFGIMCLQTDKREVVNGLANRSNYYLISIPFGSKENVDKKMSDALVWLKKFNIDVINMSFTYKYESEQFKNYLQQFYYSGAIIVNSYSEDFKFPHSYQFVIGAGKELISKDSFYSAKSNNQFLTLNHV